MRAPMPNAVVVALLLAGGATVARTADPSAADPAPAVDAIFAEWKADTPGCAVAVSKGGKEVLARAYGSADLEHGVANAPDTIFEAGSVSKQFTAAAVLLLAQAGKLKLEDPVREYVPELPDYGTPDITLRHLLHHTSGLRDWGTVTYAAGWPRGARVHTMAHVLDVVSRQKSLNFRPGAEYSYTNTGYNLLAIIVERTSGKTFAQYTHDMIFAPLGMTHTQWRDDFTRIVKGRALAYDLRPDGYHNQMPFEDVYGNGGLLTTVGDLLRWNRNFTSERVGGHALVTELQRRGRLDDGLEISYARGLEITTFRGVPEVSHSGGTAGYRSFLTRYPDQGLSVAVLCNAGNAKAWISAHKVAEAYLGSALAPATPPSPAPVDAALLARWAGLYRNVSTGESLRITMEKGALQADGQGALVPVSDSLFVLGDGPDRLQFRGADVARSFDRVDRDGFKVHYAIAAEVKPSADELARYEGTYVSDEAEAAYTVTVENGSLVAIRRPGVRFALAPSYHDAFTNADLPLVLFRRDARGQVVALSLGLGRVRDLRFRRAPAPASASASSPSGG